MANWPVDDDIVKEIKRLGAEEDNELHDRGVTWSINHLLRKSLSLKSKRVEVAT